MAFRVISGENICNLLFNHYKTYHEKVFNPFGQVRLVIPKNIGMDLKLNASKISTQNLENFSGTNKTEEISGTVNGGGIPVTVDDDGGKIEVVFE